MKKMLHLILCVFLFASLFMACEKAPGDSEGNICQQFSVGYGAVDVSPKDSVMLSGFGDYQDRYSTKVTEPIMITCIAVTDGNGETVLVLAYDLSTAADFWSRPAREAVSEATGIPFDHIMLTCSHSHSSPYVSGHRDYQVLLKDQSVVAAQLALADRAPATMHGSYTRIEETVSCNRHYLLADGTYMGEEVGLVPKDQLIGHFAKPDNLLQVIKFEREEKKDIVMMNWQAHYLGSKLDYYACSSDYPGVMRATVEKALDCHSIFILSASGNLNSWSQTPAEMEFQYHTELGQFLGNKIIDMNDALKPMDTGIVQLTEVMQPCRSISKKGELIKIPIYALSFGDFGMVFAPYEMFDTNAMAVRDQSPFPMTMVASCSNEHHSYIPTPPSWDWEKKYEVRITKFEKGTAEELQQKFVDMLTEQFHAAGYTLREKGEGYVTPEFVPETDGLDYTRVSTEATAVSNGFYAFQMFDGTTVKNMLAIDEATAQKVLARESGKLVFNEQNVVIDIVE